MLYLLISDMILLKLHQDYEVCHHSFVLMKMYTPENDVVLFLLHFWLYVVVVVIFFFKYKILIQNFFYLCHH